MMLVDWCWMPAIGFVVGVCFNVADCIRVDGCRTARLDVLPCMWYLIVHGFLATRLPTRALTLAARKARSQLALQQIPLHWTEAV